MNNSELIKRAVATHDLSRTEMVQLLKDDTINEELFKAADDVRKKHVGDEVHLRALIEFSNVCMQNCKYCGLRKDNKNVERYRLSTEDVLGFAKKASEYGFKTVVLQSGEVADSPFANEQMCEIISGIKKLDMAVTLSLGEKTYEEYKAYKDAGADRFLLRIETTDANLYKNMHPKMNLENRKRCLNDLKVLGFETGSGCLVGLPEQTAESLADDILFFKEIDADMIGIGPFIPNPETPLKAALGGTLTQALKVMALTRLLLPNINIPATTAMETLHPEGRIIALQCGANVVMPNVTEGDYRKKYEIYPGKISVNDSPKECRDNIGVKIKALGRTISKGYGFRGGAKNNEN